MGSRQTSQGIPPAVLLTCTEKCILLRFPFNSQGFAWDCSSLAWPPVFSVYLCVLSLDGFCTYGTNLLADMKHILLTSFSPAIFAFISFDVVLNLE